jgi:pyruvate,water dikinase
MLTREFGDALLKDKIDRDELTKRTESCVYYVEKGNDEVFTGQKAEEFKKLVAQKEVEDVDEFSGQTGCIGKAAGEVKIVIRPADMQKMNDGDILVSIATDPDIVPAMKKAAAFVTEQGGVTSHAAIVAREMGKPCVIGTKIATRVLKDGDYVEVDATKGVVKIISKAKDEKD